MRAIRNARGKGKQMPALLSLALFGLALLCLALAGHVADASTGDAGASGSPAASTSPSATPTPVWKLKSYRRIGGDRSFKAQLADELAAPPELLVMGGSRAMRFEPARFLEWAGLHTLNAAVQNCRPEDLYAMASYLYQRSPDTRLHCFFAVQATTFRDSQLNAGLLYDRRLAQWFPADLVAAQKTSLGKPRPKEVLGINRYTERGLLVRNIYDVRRERPGYSLDRRLDGYIKAIRPLAAWRGRTAAPRAHLYFERAVKLFNDHDVVPVVVVMPYHPRALRAFRAVGFQHQVDELLAYFKRAQTRCEFRVVDLLELRSFGGDPRWFYDGAHVTRENARRIIKRTLQLAPECFD